MWSLGVLLGLGFLFKLAHDARLNFKKITEDHRGRAPAKVNNHPLQWRDYKMRSIDHASVKSGYGQSMGKPAGMHDQVS